jgi:hypothetical protein
MAKIDPAIQAHLEWIGFVQPTGLVVAAPALVRAGAILNRQDSEGQKLLRASLDTSSVAEGAGEGYGGGLDYTDGRIGDFSSFARSVLGWSFSPKGYAGTEENPIPAELEVNLPEYGETLRPTYAVREFDPRDGGPPWQLLVDVLGPGEDFDKVASGAGRLEAAPHGRMERLLRQTGVSAGLLVNGAALRLISAPRGESSGWLDFRVPDMAETAGRPISTAMRLLLSEDRLLTLSRSERLAALLEDSRKFQNEVSERLAEQVLHGLYELLRGFQAAQDASKGELLREVLAEHPDEVYRSLLTVMLRLVFLLYAEERDMLPKDETFGRSYSLAGLYERLREDAALNPDTMEQRYGAWAQLLVLFRLIHDGGEAGQMRLPKRHGVLFDPDRFKFLEGRIGSSGRQIHERIEPPLLSDGTIYRVLEKLLVLDGERISYRALDVEQIGSVYETMMGFRLQSASGLSIAVRPQKAHGAPAAVDLEALLAEPGGKRERWLLDQANRKLSDKGKKSVASAATLEELHAALLPVIDRAATPDLVPKGAMVLQPSEERRRSGSHYTPRALTEPIVRTTLEPILKRLRGPDGKTPRPEQILDLKVCDPAMGSGAFLVEVCRQLGDALVESWHAHNQVPTIPSDEDERVFARRLIAQRCLYGVDRNPVAVDLAKMSLWLVTLAREHPLTFVDHALRHGDSLVGLSRKQIEAFHWDQAERPTTQLSEQLKEKIAKVSALRGQIRSAGEDVSDRQRHDLWDEAQVELGKVRLYGDLAVAAYFEGETSREREAKRSEFVKIVLDGAAGRYRGWLEERRYADPPLAAFHWPIEFPEVFDRQTPGFDAFVGNPPFMAGSKISSIAGQPYLDWVLALHEGSHGNGDIVAHFFRRAFELLRSDGTLGFIATNTIAQGDTRATGLRWICQHGGQIFSVRKRVKWPGMAAVVVSIVHVTRGRFEGRKLLDGREVDQINAFLFHRGGNEEPVGLLSNAGKSFSGAKIYGQGFTFDDTDRNGVATSIAEMERLIAKDSRSREAIFPYIGGEEVNSSPTHAYHRYAINFGERSEEECRRRWPGLMTIVEEKVRPERLRNNREGYRRYWWQYGEKRVDLWKAIAQLDHVLVISAVTSHHAFASLASKMVYAHSLNIFALSGHQAFCVLQGRCHEIWSRFFGSSFKDDLRYNPTDCFETFPFPENWETSPALEAAGREYFDFRAELMKRNDEGLTKTYNRFHDPQEDDTEIARLRELHAAMDRAVLDAYGWTDVLTDCDFLLDYEVEEEEWGDRKKPYRYRWPDEAREEALARLLELNARRAAEEARSGAAPGKKRGAKRKAVVADDSANGKLFS